MLYSEHVAKKGVVHIAKIASNPKYFVGGRPFGTATAGSLKLPSVSWQF